MSWWSSCLVGLATGLLSGMGIGGGSLLLLWLTAVAGMEPYPAGAINLFYFCCCAPPALWQHQKNRLVCWSAVKGSLWGIPICIAAAWLASGMEAAWLHRSFGLLLLVVGWKELRARK